jgi:hypothetical protein
MTSTIDINTIDLNIENYSLEDLYNVFNIPQGKLLNEKDIKNAYTCVLHTHPDKSKLDKNIFIFYLKAFKMLKQTYTYTHTMTTNTCVNREKMISDRMYQDQDQAKDSLYNNVLHNKLKQINQDKTKYYNFERTRKRYDTTKNPHKTPEELDQMFHRWFMKKFHKPYNVWLNESFEKSKIKYADEEGYEDWLKSDEGISKPEDLTGTKDEILQRHRKNLMQIVSYNGLQDTTYTNHTTSIDRNQPEYYSSDVFAQLKYEDIRKAHTETVILVDENDIHTKQQFKNVDELSRHRKENEKYLSKDEYDAIERNQIQMQHRQDTSRAYNLVKQMEEIKKKNDTFFSSLKLLS